MKPEESEIYQQFAKLMSWADKHRKLNVRTNADKPDQAAAAVAFGAEGIGLCRTEHMFFDHLDEMREMILADTKEAREKAARQAAAVPAGRLRRALPGDEGPAGHDPPARSAAARVPVRHHDEQPDLADKLAKNLGVSQGRRSRAASKSCTNSTRCSATAAAGWASSIRRSPPCRPGPSSRPPASSRRKGSTSSRKS